MGRTAKVVAFSTTPAMAGDIDRAAADEGVSRSELIRSAVTHYLGSRHTQSENARELTAAYPIAPSGRAVPPLYGLHRVLVSRGAVEEICARHGVRRLWLYGSAVRDDFVPGRSDYDFQVEFEAGFDLGPWATHLFDLRAELEALLGAEVDIGQVLPIENPFLRAAIERERVLVHESP
jgi:predicted nucleotidyltransferase